ncbi:EboA domain-containing protein [Kineosporia sp. J2-2]|uniref:EboA domain-containing protein n=1 Tax=Kineosporia corallincola TaxID=2835133 RepID=A0ABS5T972_9ACTN|nr:EboA domain-containing protein [Kineosporia corallincola]MBT0767582.1 EboA domain-containing protein [Kineosporia corallincola]
MEHDDWLEHAVRQTARAPVTIRRWFPMVARKVGDDHVEARIRLLAALPDRTEIPGLYRYGDVHERRAVVLSAGRLGVDDMLLDLARDALRSNDPRLVTAAADPAVVAALPDDEVDQALMKVIFMGIPTARVPALVARVTPLTSRRVAGFVLERVCAGREVAAEVWQVIDRYPPVAELEQIREQLHADDPERRRAAAGALARRG